MKLSKERIERIEDTITILQRIKKNMIVEADKSRFDNIKKELGIDFHNILIKQRDVKEYVKDNEKNLVRYDMGIRKLNGRVINTFLYFPFQVQKSKVVK